MRRKPLRRTRRQQGELSLKQLENIETRASSAYHELKEAWHFQHVIPNHDGEDSDNWEALYYPIGDALRSLHALVALLEGAVPPVIEQWDEDVFQPDGSGRSSAAIAWQSEPPRITGRQAQPIRPWRTVVRGADA
jgi:hypothetical protein